MKPSPSSSLAIPLFRMKSQQVPTGEQRSKRRDHDDSTLSNPTAENESMKEVLKKILDALETQIRNGEEQSLVDDQEDEIKKDWMLAAAVLDRICAIAFTMVFAAGTLTTFIMFTNHT